MGKSYKQMLRRKLASSVLHIEMAMEDLIGLEAEYRVAHTDLADWLNIIALSLDQCTVFIEQFAEKAWGYVPTDWDSWRNPGHPEGTHLSHAAAGRGIPQENRGVGGDGDSVVPER
jgi:hypothetical protein